MLQKVMANQLDPGDYCMVLANGARHIGKVVCRTNANWVWFGSGIHTSCTSNSVIKETRHLVPVSPTSDCYQLDKTAYDLLRLGF